MTAPKKEALIAQADTPAKFKDAAPYPVQFALECLVIYMEREL